MFRSLTLAGLLLATGMSAAAQAHPGALALDARRTDLAMAINAGRDTGAITWTEGLKLRRQLAAIDRTTRELKADGHLSAQDRRILRSMHDSLEGQIVAEATDFRQRRFLPRIGN